MPWVVCCRLMANVEIPGYLNDIFDLTPADSEGLFTTPRDL